MEKHYRKTVMAHLWLVNIILDMRLVSRLFNEGPTARHQFYILKVPSLSLQFEVGVHS